ncbi:Trk system potassium transporter TrkA [Nitratidesulfovibrio sp. HK-II]|uniref:Trk system potassium transporter TrkA n=1 Tax=Nitratidesulfovibrio sp. HK-II TaxID=2009266 RepID=UPI000E2ECEA1|nr:Trk system potassium transporter TrkA [Nitratidesulfovibrio sp. HK-II]GBO96016.1 Trk system potassium uptake protein TrkA [Nitratidesulfovibrio sp. HK-II]
MAFFRRQPQSEQLKIVIIGAGEVGFHIAGRLSRENKQVVVIDQNPEALRRVTDAMDVQAVLGSGSSPSVLSEAGADEAGIILAVTDSDEINIIACLFANAIAPDAVKLARIRNEEYTLYHDALRGDALRISMLINPEVEVVRTIDRMLSVPGAVEYGEFAGGRIKMAGIGVDKGPLVGQKLMRFREIVGEGAIMVAAIVRDDRLIIPTGADVIQQGDIVYFVYDEGTRPALLASLAREERTIRHALIVGGGNIGLRLARLFERKGYHTKLVDRDAARCAQLAEQLDTTLVLHGDGTDQALLREENVAGMDVVVAVTGDEETNILSCLLAKSMGAAQTVTRVNKAEYQPLVRAIGIEHSVSPRLSAVNSILHFVRQGKVLSSISVRGDEAEAMEAVAQEHSAIVGKPVSQLDFPVGALLLAVLRGDDVFIPRGDTVIQPQDRIIILSTRQAVSRVEQALMVSLKSF